MKKASQGFTLVEIAIVLVIIGLLLGGILKGQEMITQAKIKNVMADFSGISAAYHGYQDRYRAIPGDDPQAASRWTGAAVHATPAEVGNGRIQGTWNSGTAGDEARLWWDHLRRAGFVSGSGTQQPFNAVTGMIGVQTGDGQATTGPALGTDSTGLNGFTSLIICSGNLPDKIAIAADTQMDDGNPEAGTVRGQTQSGPNPVIGKEAIDKYQETGTNTYTLCRSL
jgi:prepilin-type N-terminal cleavage/methylation domain-containing protein